MRKIAYLSIDVHARNCVLGDMDGNGKFRGNHSFITCENNIIKALKAVKAKRKYLVMEAGPLSNWAAQVANDHVTEAIICDPRENALIYKSSKNTIKSILKNYAACSGAANIKPSIDRKMISAPSLKLPYSTIWICVTS